MLKVVCAIIRDEKGRFLLVQRSAEMKHPLQWEFPGGKVEDGEAPAAAIKRELAEELAVSVEPGEILNTVIWQYPGKKVGLIPIICELRFNQIRLWEHSRYGWFYPAEFDKLDLLEADRVILNQLQ